MEQFSKKKIAGIFGLFFLMASIGITLIVVGQRQNVRKDASEPGTADGEVTVSLSPAAETLSTGEVTETTIRIDTGGTAISAVSIHLTYLHSSQTPDLTLSDLTLVSTQTAWNCPVKTITEDTTSSHIEIGCITTQSAGYTSIGVTDFASFTLTANSTPSVNPAIFRFDPNRSFISRKSDNQDILLTPISTGEFTITAGDPGTGTPTLTITPTGVGGINPTITPTISPTPGSITGIPTSTLTPFPTITPVPTTRVATITPIPSLPVTGDPNGTLWGIFAGVAIIVLGTALLF